MKILQASDSFFPNVDGPNSVMVNLAKQLIAKGHEVELLVPKFPQIVEVKGLKIHRSPSIPAGEGYRCSLPALSAKLKKLMKEGGFDVIHLHSPFTVARFVLKWGKKLNIPVIITVHTKFKDEFRNRVKLPPLVAFMQHFVLKSISGCTGVTSVSKGMVDTLGEYGYKKCGEVQVIYNGTETPRLGADKTAVEKLRRELGIEDKFAFAFAGRLAEVKNVQFSLRALAKVKERGYDNFKFIIIGDGDYGKTLKALAKELNLTENIYFAGRITDRKLLSEYYSACDLMLFPSVFDNASIVLLEASANGLPACTVTGSCSAERIENGVSGFAWENNPDVWADNIVALLNDPDAVSRAGIGASERFYLGWEEITEEYLALYNKLLSERRLGQKTNL